MFRDGRLQESLTLPPTNPVAMLKGGRQLKPEESVNWSIGAIFALGPVNFTLDWFQISVDGRIVLTEQDLSAANRAELIAANGVGADTVTAVAFFVNDIDTETTGLDLVANTAFDFAGGRGNLTLAWNVTETEILDPGATLSDAGVRELEAGLPAGRGTLTFDYARDTWSGLLRWRYRRRLRASVQLRVVLDRNRSDERRRRRIELGAFRPLHRNSRDQEHQRQTAGQASLRGRSRLPGRGLRAQPAGRIQRRELLPTVERRRLADRVPSRLCAT